MDATSQQAEASDPSLVAIGSAVRQQRNLRRMTQDQLATATGFTRQTIIALEKGHGANLLVFARAMQVLGMHISGTPMPRRPGIKELMANKRKQRAAMDLERAASQTVSHQAREIVAPEPATTDRPGQKERM